MSITITTDIFCDNCSSWTNGYFGTRPNRKKAKKEAAKKGWSVGNKHLCPLCNGKADYKYNDGDYRFKQAAK